MNNFPDSFTSDSFQPRSDSVHDNSNVFFLRTSTHEDAVLWGVGPIDVKSTVVFIKVQDPDKWECRSLLQNKGLNIDTFVPGKTIKKFCADNRSDVRIATIPNTGYYRVITIVWSPEGHDKDPVRDGDIMEQAVEQQFGDEIATARKGRNVQMVGKALLGKLIGSHVH